LTERKIQIDGSFIRFEDFELYDELSEWVNNIEGYRLPLDAFNDFFLELKDQQNFE